MQTGNLKIYVARNHVIDAKPHPAMPEDVMVLQHHPIPEGGTPEWTLTLDRRTFDVLFREVTLEVPKKTPSKPVDPEAQKSGGSPA